MGNLHAVGVSPPPIVLHPPQSGVSTVPAQDGHPELPKPIQPLSADHPGSFEDVHKACKDVFPTPFEGARLVVNKGLSNHFQISHTLTMSSVQPSGYRFGSTYVGTHQFGAPNEAFPVIVGEIDPSGNLNANIIHQFNKNLKAKFVAQVQQSKWQATQVSADYRGNDYTASVTLGNPDLIAGSGVLVMQYLQAVGRRVKLGAELLYQRGAQTPGGELAVFSMAGKYSADNWHGSLTLCPMAGAFHGCYWHRVSDSLQAGIELETSLRMQESTATIGYQYEIPAAGCVFRGQLDSNWSLAAIMEKKLAPMPLSLQLSAWGNHVKSSYRFGIGLMLG